MDAEEMAGAIAYELNKDGWKAVQDGDAIEFTNENGEAFRITVEALGPEE
jgi:hypothetical protein